MDSRVAMPQKACPTAEAKDVHRLRPSGCDLCPASFLLGLVT
ncbi:hypothetical protein [Elizabethkingia anophelis]|nr:hypothetical protein [Elizabethkingia anophelis]